MAEVAIIGGTGLTKMEGLTITSREMVKTPYGRPSGPLINGELFGREVTFLARHGHRHSIPPHKVNYRANIWALKSIGVKHVFAIGAVGGISKQCEPTVIVIPDQIIDYTYGREHTYYDQTGEDLEHIGFSYPYTDSLRNLLIEGAKKTDVKLIEKGTHGVTQGPRLETAAEIKRMRKDGCTIVGMTGMPEAALAREIGLQYAALTMVVNWAAGIEPKEIDFKEVKTYIKLGTGEVRKVLQSTFTAWS